MIADEIRLQYASDLQETLYVRRYTGAGVNRPRFDVKVTHGKIRRYASKELVGAIQQGDSQVIVLVEDLYGKGLALPVTTADKIVEGGSAGRELAILSRKDRKALDGTLIAYEFHARG